MMQDWLKTAAQTHGDRTALIMPERRLTFAALDHEVDEAAAWLTWKDTGYQRGDRVCLLPSNLYISTLLVYAAARIGLTLVLLNTRLTDAELDDQAALIGESGYWDTPRTTVEDWHDKSLQKYEAQPLLDLDSTAAILFTSGTSGTPKAAQLTYGNFYASALASADRLGVRPEDRWLLCLPLYHVGGLSILYRSVIHGTTVVIPRENSIESIMSTIQHDQISHISLVPTQLYRIIQAGFVPPPSLKLILLGGAAASPELLKMAADRQIPVATTYGLTEATSQVATMLPDAVRRKLGSVGKAISGTRVRVVDEYGQDQPPDVYGEIVVSGQTVMKGYLGQPETNGVFHTGDIGYLDDEGDLWVVQRRSDLIVSGGENVYPAEIEQVLRQHPSIEDAAVVGIDHAEWGQQVVAAVVIRYGMVLTQEDVIAHTRAHMAGYKIPRQVRFVDSLPQTANGKIQRAAVKKLFTDKS